jgi:single-strand DNA-binding protein
MPSLNKVILIGHLGKDPEVKYLPSGTTVATTSLATSEKYQKDGEWKENTEWHNIVAYGKAAEILGEYFKKGNLTYIEGKLRTRSWEKDGIKKYATEVVAFAVKNLSPRQRDNDSGPGVDDDVPF